MIVGDQPSEHHALTTDPRVHIDVVLKEDRPKAIRELRDHLLRSPRRVPAQYFYDDHGSHLFEDITELPEYYQTRTERALLEQIGYHCRDYFTAQWDKFEHLSWGVLAHSTHVKGAGTYVHGVERPRVTVELATGISALKCSKINLGYRDPATVRVEDFAGREDEGVLLVERAGEILYRP